MRGISETPWNQGQLEGTRTTVSSPSDSFLWNNINWHIGYRVYPSVPWYDRIELHKILESEIKARGAVVGKSYLAVFLNALLRGSESVERLAQVLDRRRAAGRGCVQGRRKPELAPRPVVSGKTAILCSTW